MPVLIFVPMFTFVTLLAVGLDYDIFMVTRVRESVIKGSGDEEAIARGVTENGGA
ncbi:MMPL family transporter [Thermogymnomonas acidicola]|uniref:MMPL family transporter n=1 Tax=Thermogymnomonas acidicola TaxID=399579 RepID=UPI001396A419|nr:MMPL family transporter [Thermogymnomonas acidicola]